MIKKITITLFLLTTICFAKAQLEYSKWVFGQNAGLDFTNSPPTTFTNVSNDVSTSAISDNSGTLLFYTNGMGVLNKNHVGMANGSGLLGGPSSGAMQSIIVKKPSSPNLYYIFTLASGGYTSGLCYSVVDMNLAAGLGSVTVKNATVYTPTCEKQVAVSHCNGKDVWILSHEFNSNNFRAYLLTANGLNTTPVISSIGEVVGTHGYNAAGFMKISPDGKKLAVSTASATPPASLNPGGFYLFDFDAATGVISNSLTLLTAGGTFNAKTGGLEFSADGTKLYGTATSNTTSIFYQWDVCAASPSAIIASQYSVNMNGSFIGGMQRGIDNKIYVATSGLQSLAVINSPNMSGAACNFVFSGISLAPKISYSGLCYFTVPYTKPAPQQFSASVACNVVSYSPSIATFSSGCSTVPYPPSGYVWDFGEPSSGAANSSTISNPQHSYANAGTYTVSLIMQNPCSNDTVTKVVTITTIGPAPAVSGPTAICKGDRYTYSATGGSTFAWSNGANTTSVALSPTQTSAYTVSATANGCTVSKTFTVTVNPCVGINAFSAEAPVKAYPNPFDDTFTIESLTDGDIEISTLEGKLIYKTKITEGQNQLNTSELSKGVYILKLSSKAGEWRGKVVKSE